MATMSQCVLVSPDVAAGSPMTMSEGGPNAGKVASKFGENWRGREYKSSADFWNSLGGSGKCVRNSVSAVTSKRGAGALLQPGQTLS